jgi:dipeptidyl aminopeptidase/acylaminoacyl peptidase
MAARRAFTPADAWLLRGVADPQLSPDGCRVAYVVSTPDRASDTNQTAVFVASTKGEGAPRRFSTGPADSAPRWSPDGTSLAYLSDRGNKAQIVVANLEGGEPRLLTAVAGGISQPCWSPDSRHLAFVASGGPVNPDPPASPDSATPGEAAEATTSSAPRVLTGMRYRFDGLGVFDVARRHIFVVEVATGAVRAVTDGDFDDADPAWSPDGCEIAFCSDRSAERFDRERRDLYVTPVRGRRRARRLTEGRGSAGAPVFSPDGVTIAFVGHENGDGNSAANSHLYLVPADASAKPRSLSGPLDRTVVGLVRPLGNTHAFTRTGKAVLFLAVDRGAVSLFEVAVRGGMPTSLLGGDRQILGFSLEAEQLALVSQWPSDPVEISCATAVGTDERRVSDANADLCATVKLAPVRRISHKASDGRTIESYLLRPPGLKRGQPAPLVLEIHGGPHSWHPQGSMLALYQSLAAAGYLVLLPNPRGSQGFGQEFAEACVGDWGGADFADLMGAVDALVEEGSADPHRLYVAGYSYGGYMTSWVVGHTQRFRAAAISAPVTDLMSMFGTTDIPYFSAHEIGGLPFDRREEYAKRSPITYLDDVTTPVLLLHWEGDLRCPIGQSEEMFQGLRMLGREVVFVRYPGGFHISHTPSQWADWTERILDWFAEHDA